MIRLDIDSISNSIRLDIDSISNSIRVIDSNRQAIENVVIMSRISIFEFITSRLSRDLFAKNETIFFFIIFSLFALFNCITMQHFKEKIIRFNTQFMSTNSTTKSLHVLASRVENSSRYSISTL